MKKKNVSNKVGSKIPILNFHKDGIFETAKNFYTEMYAVEQVKIQDATIFRHKINQLYLSMPNDVVFQIVAHNTLIPKEDYLKTVLVPQDKYEQAATYNRTVLDAMSIGCNNVKKCVYLVVGHKNTSFEEAKKFFEEHRPIIMKAFGDIQIRKLDSLERLEMLYHVFNPQKNEFAKEIDLKNDGNISLSNLQYMKMTEKDLISPKKWNTVQKLLDYTILDEGLETQCYSRSVFLNCIPKEVSINVISDLTSVSSNMLFSFFYHPVDAKLGFDATSEVVKKNTNIIKKQKRETIQDKKNRTVITLTERKEINEDVYFYEAALDLTKEMVASAGVMMETSAIITLFADSLEELDKKTEILHISAAKFACSVKALDMLQKEGFCSSLPLCRQQVNVSRFLPSERVAQLSPIVAAEVSKHGGAFYGLNSINDNLVCINRKHGVNLSGVITGMEHSGKTYQMKREIMNALLTTPDQVNIITFGDEYDEFVKSFSGIINKIPYKNPFVMTNEYGLTVPSKIAKEAFITAFCGDKKEAKKFLSNKIDFNNDYVVDGLIKDFPTIHTAYENISEEIIGTYNTNRLALYKAKNITDFLVIMEYLWNKGIEEKKKNRTTWTFLDNVDNFLLAGNEELTEARMEYLLKYLKNSNSLRNIVTVLIQDAVGLMANISSTISLEELTSSCGYVKLLNQGPIERKKFVDILNIPNALVSYITNVEPSQGLIITPVSNVAFNDNFLDRGNAFSEICNV